VAVTEGGSDPLKVDEDSVISTSSSISESCRLRLLDVVANIGGDVVCGVDACAVLD
jgi:hypothetical protein